MYYKCRYWEFLKVDDVKIIETEFIYMGPCTPTKTTKQGYKFKDDKAIEITNFLII